MGCAALMVQLLCSPCYYVGRHWTVTPGSRGSGITEGTRRHHEGMTACAKQYG